MDNGHRGGNASASAPTECQLAIPEASAALMPLQADRGDEGMLAAPDQAAGRRQGGAAEALHSAGKVLRIKLVYSAGDTRYCSHLL